MEPSPIRDTGPYLDAAAARAQFDAVTFGVPDPGAGAGLVLGEALLMAGVQPSDFEAGVVADLGQRLDPVTVQVIAGWLVRAHRAGDVGRRPEPV